MKTVKFYLEVEIPNELEAIAHMFKFVKHAKEDHKQINETRIIFTGGVKDSEGYFVTNDSPYLLGGCWPVDTDIKFYK